MSRNRRKTNAPAPAAVNDQAKRWNYTDGFTNFEARVGVGTNNQSSASGYSFDFITRNRVQMEAMYRSSWVVGQAVDVVAEDMTRAGITIKSTLKPESIDKINAGFLKLQIWNALCDNIKWGRLYGGSLAVMLIDGQKPETPLNLDSVGPGSFKGLLVLDRWLVQPTLTMLVKDLGPDLGKPMFYDVVADSMALGRQRIHYSRVIRVDGVDLPYWQRIAENLWGQSIIERLFDRLVAFDSTTSGAAQLVYKAHLRTLSVEGLRELIGTGGPAMEGLVKQIEMMRRYQSNEGFTLLDANDKFEAHQYTFAGLSDMLLQFGQQLCGALQIPGVRLFGQSPAGLNSTGEGDMKQYHENISQQQERRLRTGLTTLLDVLHRSEVGGPPPTDLSFTFNSLQKMSDTEKADIASKITTAVTAAVEGGLVDPATGLKELRQSSDVTGVWTNITDEQITEAENAPPPVSEVDPNAPADPNAGPQEDKPDTGA